MRDARGARIVIRGHWRWLAESLASSSLTSGLVAALVVIIPVGVVLALFPLLLGVSLTAIGWLLFWSMALSMVIAAIVVLAVGLYQRLDPAALLRRRARQRRCAACGFALKNLTMEADGCTVCPECGAAWRIPKKSFEDLGSA